MPLFLKNKKYYGERITVAENCYYFLGTYSLKGNQCYLYVNSNCTNRQVAAIEIVFKSNFKKLFAVIQNELKAKRHFSPQDSNSFYFLYRGWQYRLSDHIHPKKGRKSFFEILIGATDALVEVNSIGIDINEVDSVNDVYLFVKNELKKTNKKTL